ncbi:MAG: flagellar export protein FliJ [Gammaproteobacteria bacterium]|nr:flagellar export protein FliJ [Gammaproteobacteria bacterium]
MPRKSKRMQSILELAKHDEQAAIEALGESNRIVEAHIKQLEELKLYRDEYRQQMLQEGEAGFSAGKLQQFHQFLLKLDEIIVQQGQQIVVSEQIREQKRVAWLESRTRTNSLDKVAQRYRETENEEDQRRDQKESDEVAQQRR